MERKQMNRREFIKKSVGCATYAAIGAVLPGAGRNSAHAAKVPDVIVANGPPAAATRAAVDILGGMKQFVKRGDRVVIKPNMSFPNPPGWATTTHPDVVRQLTTLCVDAGASSILVLDNPLRNSELSLKRSGLKEACEGLPVTQVRGLTSKRFYRSVPVPRGKELKTTMVMKQVLDADVLIAAPVTKSHSATGVSLAMKGMMGLIYDRREFHLNLDLDEAVVDLCTILRPTLTLIDASRVLTTGGPGGPGKVLPMNKVVASTDMVAADALAVELGTWYGRKFKARQVRHVKLAHERGLGNMNTAQFSIKEVTA